MTSPGPSWTNEDEEEFSRLLGEIRRDTAERPNADETEEDAILAGRLNRLLARRRAAQRAARLGLTNSAIPAEIVEAYRNARYEFEWITIGVDDRHQIASLTLDVPNPYLEALMNMTGRSTSAFITAHNPLGRQLSDEENAARHAALEAEAKKAGYPAFPGQGSDPDGTWPPEASLLLLGLSRDAACEIGARFEQNAILFADSDFIPRLVLLR